MTGQWIDHTINNGQCTVGIEPQYIQSADS